jgi:hypothetical protein
MVATATFFATAVLLHNFDHLRRGGSSVSADVFWIGTLAIVDEVGVVVLAFLRHPRAPLAAVISGATLAAGYVFVHFTPRRTWLSDSLVSGHASPVSIAAASLETIAALALAIVGALAIKTPRHDREAMRPRDTFRHPVVVAMIVGNAVVLIGSLATR